MVKNLSTIQETCVRSLVWKDPLEKGKATQGKASILAWRVHGLHSPCGRKDSDVTEHLSLSLSLIDHLVKNLPAV